MTSRADRLARYLDEVGMEADFFARSNCLLFLGRWVARERPTYDPAPWVGACANAIEAARILRREGGPDVFFAREAAAAGLSSIDPAEAALGDVALIRLKRLDRPYEVTLGAIRAADFWAIRVFGGVTTLGARTMRVAPHLAWKV